MDNFGFVRVAAAVPSVYTGNGDRCAASVINLIDEAVGQHADIIVFPELTLVGSTCGSLLKSSLLLEQSEQALESVIEATSFLDITIVLGLTVRIKSVIRNVAAVIRKGIISGVYCPDVENQYITLNGQEVQVGPDMIFKSGYVSFAIAHGKQANPESKYILRRKYREAGAQILLCMASVPEYVGGEENLCSAIKYISKSNSMAVVYAGAGQGESDTDFYYAGHAIIAENGVILGEDGNCGTDLLQINDIDVELLDNRYVSEEENNSLLSVDLNSAPQVNDGLLLRFTDPAPFSTMFGNTLEAFDIQAGALAARMRHIGAQKAVIGVSGGLDSTLALLVAARAFDMLGLDRSGIIGVTMPGFGTSGRTLDNAITMMEQLDVTTRTIDITESVREHFAAIDHDENVHNVVYENSQARERTQILMDLSNQYGAFVIGTGDLSELALGWCTYNGDQMSMYGVNGSIPKTVIPSILKAACVNYFPDQKLRDCIGDVIDTPVSPELLPPDSNGDIAQKTQDVIGPYVLHDFFLYHILYSGFAIDKIERLAIAAFETRYDPDTVDKWLKVFVKRFFAQQFKRSCMPDGVAVSPVSLSPRGVWNMPSTIDSANFF